MKNALAVFTLVVAVALVAPLRADAQTAEMAMWLSPEFGKPLGRADYRYTLFPDRGVTAQPTDFGYEQHNVTLQVPLYQDSRNEWAVGFRGRYQDFDTQAIFPGSGTPYPKELYDLRFSAGYRHKFDNDWIGGVNVTLGSASDKPFHSEDELLAQVIGFLRVPHGERNAWIFSVLYDSDTDIIGNTAIPIPGIAYQWVPSDSFQAVIGIPFSSVEWKPIEQVTLEAQYFPTRRVRARATWRIFRPLRAYVGFDWDNETYMLADRIDEDKRLFYYEKRFTAGARFDLKHVGVEVYGGYIFDRDYFIGDSYSDRRKDRFEVEAGTFVGVRVGVRWWPGGGP